jgi:hypothetical protein
LGSFIRIDDERVRDNCAMLCAWAANAMLEAETEQLCNAGSYQCRWLFVTQAEAAYVAVERAVEGQHSARRRRKKEERRS